MSANFFFIQDFQLKLFAEGDSSTGAFELFPAAWSALEAIVTQDISTQRAGLERLKELGAARHSPLITYLLISRIPDSTISIRAEIIRMLSKINSPDEEGFQAPDPVRDQLRECMCRMRTREIYALLEVGNYDPEICPNVANLLNASPFAGNHLAAILADRKTSLEIRELAGYFIGLVGYLDAMPTLERIQERLETKINGQKKMSFFSDEDKQESDLLPVIREALKQLRAP